MSLVNICFELPNDQEVDRCAACYSTKCVQKTATSHDHTVPLELPKLLPLCSVVQDCLCCSNTIETVMKRADKF